MRNSAMAAAAAAVVAGMAFTEMARASPAALARPETATWPKNATQVLVRRDAPAAAFNLASIALLGASAAILLAISMWIVAMEVKVRRQREMWRPRVPPRPSHVLLLPPGATLGNGEEGYVEPCSPPLSPTKSKRTPKPSSAPVVHGPAARAHSYLLVLANEPLGPYEEVVFPDSAKADKEPAESTSGTSGVYLRPRVTTSPQSLTDEGYLPMRSRHLPSMIKVLKNGELAIDLRAVCDEYIHMAAGVRHSNTDDHPASLTKTAEEAELSVGEDEELRTFQAQAPTRPRAGSAHPYEAVRPTTPATRLPACTRDIQSRMLPPPPLPPPPSPQRSSGAQRM